MILFIKGIIVGIGKIIPGVSGAMLAINFGIYEKLLNSIVNFFDDWKKNIKFISIFGLGVLLAIIGFSGIILYLLNNYRFITMMFFIGLIIGSTYNFSKDIIYNKKNICFIFLGVCFFLIFSIINFNNNYIIQGNINSNLIFFIGGIIEIFASIVPGISGTAMLIFIGIYDQVLEMMANVYNFSYVISHINLYISYGIGMMLSFIFNSYLINYLITKFKNTCYLFILGLTISSILLLIIITFKINFNILEFIIGVILLVIGIIFSFILNK